MSKLKVILKWFFFLLVVAFIVIVWRNWDNITDPVALDFYFFKAVLLDTWQWALICFLIGFCLAGFPLTFKFWKLKLKFKKIQKEKVYYQTQKEEESLEEE